MWCFLDPQKALLKVEKVEEFSANLLSIQKLSKQKFAGNFLIKKFWENEENSID